jgi:hypothetical protein
MQFRNQLDIVISVDFRIINKKLSRKSMNFSIVIKLSSPKSHSKYKKNKTTLLFLKNVFLPFSLNNLSNFSSNNNYSSSKNWTSTKK